jgi:uncharacterized protein (DUF2147 family)
MIDVRGGPMTRSGLRTSLLWVASGALILGAGLAAAADNTPVGTWKQYDDRQGDLRSIIRIAQAGDELVGTIEKTFLRPGELEHSTCDKCPGEFKDRPIIGLRFLWGVKGSGRDWGGGRVLDPDDGKIYRVKLSMSEDGKTLEVRGYIGISMFGRSQKWVRAEP